MRTRSGSNKDLCTLINLAGETLLQIKYFLAFLLLFIDGLWVNGLNTLADSNRLLTNLRLYVGK